MNKNMSWNKYNTFSDGTNIELSSEAIEKLKSHIITDIQQESPIDFKVVYADGTERKFETSSVVQVFKTHFKKRGKAYKRFIVKTNEIILKGVRYE